MLANSGYFEARRWGVDVVTGSVDRVVVFPGGSVMSCLCSHAFTLPVGNRFCLDRFDEISMAHREKVVRQ